MKAFYAIPLFVGAALAHFEIAFPEWRGDSFADGADQYIFPCANVSQENANRTLWPLDGGAISLELHHAWTYYAVNLGIGNEVASFKIHLTPELHNATGNGTLCIPKLNLPAGLVTEGQNASLQVVTFGESGSALYNCADITFSSEAVEPSDEQCKTNNITVEVVDPTSSQSTNGTDDGEATEPSPTPTGAAVSTYGSSIFVGALASIFAIGMSGL